MGHNLQALGTASLDTMSGLVTFASPRDLPEGASPRNWDVDYAVGSVFTRPGLASVYSFATILEITGYSLDPYTELATFTYVGTEPTVNEGFILSGFTGIYSVLNGQTVYVESFSMTQFTAFVTDGPTVSADNLSGSAVSTTGQFVGPNIGSIATSSTWTNPSNIFSPTAFTSVVGGTNEIAGPTAPTTVVTSAMGTGSVWTTPNNLVATGSSFAVTSVPASTLSETLTASGTNFSVPAGSTITGIAVSFSGKWTGSASGVFALLQLTTNGTLVGTPLNFALSGALTTYTKGSSNYTWGTSFTPTTVNGSQLGVQVRVGSTGTTGTNSISLNGLKVTVYYTLPATSEVLLAQGFGFSISTTSGISGFSTSFRAYTDSDTTLSLQLLLAGTPVGDPKVVTLTTVPTIYTLGGPTDPWGSVWSAASVNSPQFGIQITASGSGTTYAGDLDIITYVTTALENFNWVSSFEQANAALSTLALDAAGNMWVEDVINNPNVLSLSLTGILPNSFANGATFNNSEFVMFSDLSIGTDRPRQLFNDGNWYPVTQVGPGVAPSFKASTGSISGVLNLISYTYSGGVAALTFETVSTPPSVDALYVLNVPGTFLDKQVVTVLSSPAPTTSTFSANVTGTGAGGDITGTATPQFEYSITSISQTASGHSRGVIEYACPVLLSTGAGSTAAGSVVTIFYNDPSDGYSTDEVLTSQFNSGIGCYVQITGSGPNIQCDGVWQVIAVGRAIPPGAQDQHNYFSIAFNSSGASRDTGNHTIDYQLTLATLTVSPPILGLSPGTNITITGVMGTPQTGWNNTWTIVQAINSGQYTITATQYTDTPSGLATYHYQFASTTNSQVPVVGQLIEVTGCTNNAAFNGTFVINTVDTGSNTFTVVLTIDGLASQPNPIPEGSAQAIMSGTKFTIDPGINFVQTNTSVIYGTVTNQGNFFVIGSSSLVPIGAGTRQAICFFITKTGAWTPASPPITFTTNTDANILNVSGIPIGPPDVVARGIAITEAGANGVPGANFYVITVPVTETVDTVVTTYTSTIINDNTSTTAAFSFTDAVLLNSQEVDIPGFNLFNLIELGSCAWCVPYAGRMFYGLQLNKVDNFNNLSFDGGYQNPNQPAGWGLYLTANELQLVNSPVTGDAYYVSNTTGSIQPVMGMISQTAYQDSFNVAIISPNVAYSVRIAAACPSGVRLGTLNVDLVSLSGGNFGTVYGSFSVPLTSMGTIPQVFSGSLLPLGIFTGIVPSTLQLRLWVSNMGVNADVLVERLEVYPTSFPYLKTEVYGSYVNKPEAVDASGDGGIIDTSTENPQPCVGGFVLRDNLYLLKTASMYFTKDNPNSEPGGWGLNEVSNRVGAVGINAFDTGEEWAVMACRAGLFGFDGSEPKLLNLETLEIWNAINWDAGNTICVRNDINKRRILCAVPLPTGTSPEGVATATVQWLPFAPYNPKPTTPNVILMLNYQAIGSFQELMASIAVHATMFGILAAPDMRRKWSIWNIATPYMGFILRPDYLNAPLFVCNGIASSKIYEFDDTRHNDDGAVIYGLYTTYGHVNAAKAVTMPIFGMHTKRYTVLQANIQGAGTAKVRLIPNDLGARYPYTVPGGMKLTYPANDDLFKPINAKGQRVFLEFSTNALDQWFSLSKTLLTGKADPWSPLNPTGGGNMGIV